MKVTISDVARLAGVSTATVSHTINSTRYVSGETKEKVYRAIAELGYTPDASARSFRTGKKKTIGFIVPDISNKFFATMIESVENYLSAHGYHLIIANTKENPEREETNIRLLSAGLVDGLLIASTMEDFSRFESLIPAGFPVVLVDRTFDTKRFPSVSVSNFQPQRLPSGGQGRQADRHDRRPAPAVLDQGADRCLSGGGGGLRPASG